MDRDTEVMDLCFRDLEAVFFWYLLYVIRSSEVFTHDFLENTNRNVNLVLLLRIYRERLKSEWGGSLIVVEPREVLLLNLAIPIIN